MLPQSNSIESLKINEIMTQNPKKISGDAMAVEAFKILKIKTSPKLLWLMQ